MGKRRGRPKTGLRFVLRRTDGQGGWLYFSRTHLFPVAREKLATPWATEGAAMRTCTRLNQGWAVHPAAPPAGG